MGYFAPTQIVRRFDHAQQRRAGLYNREFSDRSPDSPTGVVRRNTLCRLQGFQPPDARHVFGESEYRTRPARFRSGSRTLRTTPATHIRAGGLNGEITSASSAAIVNP